MEELKVDFLINEARIKTIVSNILQNPDLFKTKVRSLKIALQNSYIWRLQYFYYKYKYNKIFHWDESEIEEKWGKYRNRLTTFLMLWNSDSQHRGEIFNVLADKKETAIKTAQKVARLFEENTIGSNEIPNVLQKNEWILPEDKVYSKEWYYKALLGLLWWFGDWDEQEAFSTWEGPKRSEETLLLQQLFAAVLHGNNIVNENQTIDFDIYTFSSWFFDIENTLPDWSAWKNAVKNMRNATWENYSSNYFDSAYEFYMFLSQQQSIPWFKVRPIIDESLPLQRGFANANLSSILWENKSRIPIIFYIPKRDITFIIRNDYWRASYILKWDISENEKFKKIGKKELKKQGIDRSDIKASNKKPLFLLSKWFSSTLKDEFDATQVNTYWAYPEKEVALNAWIERVMYVAWWKVSETIQTTLWKY